MGATLDIDDVCAGHPVALKELQVLREHEKINAEPLWVDGEPQNLKAAAADALEWLKVIRPSNKHRRALSSCIDQLNRFLNE